MLTQEVEARAANRHQVVVNGTRYDNTDPLPSGRDLLNLAGMVPASEHTLIAIRNKRTHLIGLDDKVDLSQEEGTVFRAFQSDRAFAWTLDEIGQVWGAAELSVDEVLTLFLVDPDHELVLEREDQLDVVLRPGGIVSLDGKGTEDIVTRRKRPDFVLVTVFTTAGVFPAEGAERVKPDTPVNDVLKRAAHKLDIKDTANWVVTVDGRDINPALSFAQNGLAGTVELDWGPREGGGGNA